jgi:Flp pilus assembly protein TadG
MAKTHNKIGSTRWRLRGEAGAAAVEMALVLPILLVMLFGIVDFGLTMYTQEVLANASREGARQGIRFVTPMLTDSDIVTITKDTLDKGYVDSSKATVTVTNAGGGFGTDLTVNIQYLFDFLVVSAFVPGMPSQITLQSTTVMSNE